MTYTFKRQDTERHIRAAILNRLTEMSLTLQPILQQRRTNLQNTYIPEATDFYFYRFCNKIYFFVLHKQKKFLKNFQKINNAQLLFSF